MGPVLGFGFGAGSGGAVGLQVGVRVSMSAPLRPASGETLLLTKRATLVNFPMSGVGSSSIASMAPTPGCEWWTQGAKKVI